MVRVTMKELKYEEMAEETKGRSGKGKRLIEHMDARFLSPASILSMQCRRASEDASPASTESRPPVALLPPEKGKSATPSSPTLAQHPAQSSEADRHPLNVDVDGQLAPTRMVSIGSPDQVISKSYQLLRWEQ